MKIKQQKTNLAAPWPANSLQKLTIVPILIDFEDPLSKADVVSIQDDLTFQKTETVLSPGVFDLWNDFLSSEDRKRLNAVTHALMHRFPGSLGSDKEDEKSKNFMQHVFGCLRLIKPTRKSFQFVQAYVQQDRLEVYSLSHPPHFEISLMPITQTLNRITLADIQTLRKLLPKFMFISRPNGPLYLQSAIRWYEGGYSATSEPSLQFMSWMMGLEVIFSKGEEILNQEQLVKLLKARFGKIDIKQPQWRSYLERSPGLTIAAEAEHLIELRKYLVHAQSIPQELLVPHIDHLGHSHELAQYLQAGAAMVLQAAILEEFDKIELTSI